MSLEYIWIDAKMNLRSKTKHTAEKIHLYGIMMVLQPVKRLIMILK